MRILLIIVTQFVLNISIALAGNHSQQDDWTSFRNGGASTTKSQLPMQWSPKSGIAWHIELRGYGQSTPVVAKGRVFISSVEGNMKDKCVVSCYIADSGKEIWSRTVPAASKAPSNYMVSRAAPTPVVDSRAIYVFFESGDIVALGHEGQRLWHRNLVNDYGSFQNHHGLGSSPAQTSDTIFLNIEHQGPIYLIAIDKETGKTKWKVPRPSENSWTSPIIYDQGSKVQVILSSARMVAAYNTIDGQQIWKIDGLEGNSVPSPTVAENRLYVGARIPEFGSASIAAKSNICLQLPSGKNDEHQVVWRSEQAVCDYASPVISGNCVYYLNKVGVLFCVDRITGKTHYVQRLRATCWATPIVSKKKIYFFDKNGTTKIIQSGPKFKLIGKNQFWDPDHPPKPATYKEYSGHGGSHSHTAASPNPSKKSGGQPQGGLIQRLLTNDKNKDGKLQEQELPARFRSVLPRIDTNKDRILDMDELKAMEASFRKRRESSRESAQDPIVYGAAASNGALFVRTGTRLYSVKVSP